MDKLKAAIYHFTGGENKRPAVYENRIEKLKEYAISQGFEVKEVFFDKSGLMKDRTAFRELLLRCEEFDVVVVNDFFHISRNTMRCMDIMKELKDKGVMIYSPVNGRFEWADEPVEEPLRAATYICRFGPPNEMQQTIPVYNEVFKLYVDKKTNWEIVDQYYDRSLRQHNKEQKNLMKLIENKDKYDILLVHNINDVHWRTADMCKVRDKLGFGICSLQDGYLKYSEVGKA